MFVAPRREAVVRAWCEDLDGQVIEADDLDPALSWAELYDEERLVRSAVGVPDPAGGFLVRFVFANVAAAVGEAYFVRVHLVRADLQNAVDKTRNCCVELIMKDITSVTNEPQRQWEWADIAMDAGAYPGSPAPQAIVCAYACYDVEHGKLDSYDVVVNKPKTAAYRAPGSPQATFGVEE